MFLRRAREPSKLGLLLAPPPGRGRSPLCFAGKLEVAFQPARIEPTVLHCTAYGASCFMPVTTVPEAAFKCQRLDVNERPVKTILSRANLQLAHSGSVN
jgi:hypothetical protein